VGSQISRPFVGRPRKKKRPDKKRVYETGCRGGRKSNAESDRLYTKVEGIEKWNEKQLKNTVTEKKATLTKHGKNQSLRVFLQEMKDPSRRPRKKKGKKGRGKACLRGVRTWEVAMLSLKGAMEPSGRETPWVVFGPFNGQKKGKGGKGGGSIGDRTRGLVTCKKKTRGGRTNTEGEEWEVREK